MWRFVSAGLALVLVGVVLVGCGRFGGEQRAAWRTEAEEACVARKLVQPSNAILRISEIDGPGACGITYPFKVSAFAEGTVGLTNRVTLGCPIIPQIDGWIRDTVQPAAELYFGTAVTDIRAGTYSCRGRNNQPGAKISEHAFGNAIDIMSFKFADGREMSVERGWKGQPDEQDFLREVFVGACRHFTTVLAPGSDVYHYNHLHLDLARHDARGQRRICKPILKFAPRLDPDADVAPRRAAPRPAIRSEPAEPLEIEDDNDPYAVSAAPARPAASPAASRPSAVAAAPLPAPTPIRAAAAPPSMPASPAMGGGASSYAKSYGPAAAAPDPYRGTGGTRPAADAGRLAAAPPQPRYNGSAPRPVGEPLALGAPFSESGLY
jgi:hypothetical protein